MSRRRLFVALPVGEVIAGLATAWQKEYSDLPVRWIAPKNLHITVVPPWYEENIEEVVELLKDMQGSGEAMELIFTRVSLGPRRAPCLIWAEGETPAGVPELKARIEQALEIEPERRPVFTHLTLARFREEQFASFPLKKLDDSVVWRGSIHTFILMESHLSSAGADYEIVAEFSL